MDSIENTVTDPNLVDSWPAVSVHVATCHGRAAMLDRALASVLAQTYTDYEVMVIHDGPTADADTVTVCEKYAALFDERNIVFNFGCVEDESGYYTLPRNMATFYSRGDYISNLDDDNEWTPDHLAVLVAAIEEGDHWDDLVYGRRTYVHDDDAPSEVNGVKLVEGDSEFQPWDDTAMRRLDRCTTNFIDSGDFIVTRGAMYWLAMTTGKMWNEDYRRFGDWELVARAANFGGWRFKGVDRVVQVYHIHSKNVSLTRPVNEIPTTRNLNE